MHIDYEMNTMRHQKHEFTMTVGRHSAKVICKNKRDGKQRASQAILQVFFIFFYSINKIKFIFL